MKISATAVWGGSTLPMVGVDGDAVLQLETSPLRMKKIGTNIRVDRISVGEMILGSIGYSLVWIIDEEEVSPVGLPYAMAFCSPTNPAVSRKLNMVRKNTKFFWKREMFISLMLLLRRN